MTRKHTAFLGTLLAGATVASLTVASPACAQTIPLPLPAPHTRLSQVQNPAAPPPTAAPRPPAAVAPNGAATIGKPPAVAGNGAPPQQFDAQQRALAERISAYLSGIRTLVGEFVQVGPDGSKTQGQFYLQKPGRVRFEYDDPSPIQLIADGSSVVVRDRKLATQDLYPLSQTPLRFLLADRIDLLKDTTTTGIFSDDVFSTVVIEEKQVVGGTHRLMLMFSAQDLTLKQWTITDPQGFDTTVAVYNLDPNKKPDPGLFKINYERVLQ
ncbi:MAG: outer membrane lipoprotein carrier protein LolA [Pseudorhodoplanes sp.]|nr:outer membrane lipoprotein carrier protein LolA [Pseudorhodoplanes sp.]MCQ3943319.1 outer membrane lipoprotein carrier protein LolA [Alphaproteobacteria bacterium]